jgi:hypothetical protein
MAATKGDGLDAARNQPAKTFTKSTTDFIALCIALVLNDYCLVTVVWVVCLQALFMAMGALVYG